MGFFADLEVSGYNESDYDGASPFGHNVTQQYHEEPTKGNIMGDMADLAMEQAEKEEWDIPAVPDIKPGQVALRPQVSDIKPKTPSELRVEQVNIALAQAYQQAGQLTVTKEEAAILARPFTDDEIEIRPNDGLIYCPHIFISERLTEAFGPGQWAMIKRQGAHQGNQVYCEFVLVVRGCYVGEAPASAPYIENNSKQSLDDVYEGCQGIALRRIAAKASLGCGSQCWKPSFARKWVADNAEDVWVDKWDWKTKANKKTKIWRKKEPGGAKPPPAATTPEKPKNASGGKSAPVEGTSKAEYLPEEAEGLPWWKLIESPVKFGDINSGTAITDIPKGKLWGLWHNFRLIEGEKRPAFVKFRSALDSAGDHYKFKAKAQE